VTVLTSTFKPPFTYIHAVVGTANEEVSFANAKAEATSNDTESQRFSVLHLRKQLFNNV